MTRTWTIIGVSDVLASFNWYQSLLGRHTAAPAHDHWGQILDEDGTGLLLFFRVDDVDRALQRARTLVATFDEEPQLNPNTGTEEFALRDPDGYHVMISALPAP